MAKNQRDESQEGRRRSRKEILRERHHARQTRQLRIAVGAIVALLVLVLIVAVVVEYVVRPRQPVATVNGTNVALNDWQNRVRYQRAQFIIALEDQLEAFQDVSLVQQFAQQQIALLQQPELLGELVLEQMIDEELIRQAALERGIRVSDEEVEERLGEQFNYFGGDSPTPMPTPTDTVEPTPSLTPIPTEVITEVVPTNTPMPTVGADATQPALPTATPVSEEAYQSQLNELLSRYREMGVSEATYRNALRAQIFQEKLADRLAEEQNLSSEEEMASIFVISFGAEEEAEEGLQRIEEEGYLEVWNRIRSAPADAEEPEPGTAAEALWRTQEQLAQQYGAAVAATAFSLPLEEPSDILIQGQPDNQGIENPAIPARFHLIQVSGREMRELGEAAFENRKRQLVADLVAEHRQGGLAQIEILPLWRARVPSQPILDPVFLAPPTQPTVPQPMATPVPDVPEEPIE
ncbi:MAG TPA: SurA N-terminal domain-containing protein [Candidatus Sulfomarinibacteraceae bacterium]|nr:SurA N-terminal domain-containing protein [Candidatus Sulfomarinibacteraceae bacterium]